LTRILLDANVLISAVIRPSGPPGQVVADFLRAHSFDLVLSPAVVAEVERALALPRIQRYVLSPQEVHLWLVDLVALADLVDDTGRVAGVVRDPDDDVVLAAAVAGRAEVLVTGDQDLLALREYEGIVIVTPRAALDILRRGGQPG
jgi:hypothetical protein